MHPSYKECSACSLPYIDQINGRDGICDFCAKVAAKVAAMAPETGHEATQEFGKGKSA
jgi:hypothetical protein